MLTIGPTSVASVKDGEIALHHTSDVSCALDLTRQLVHYYLRLMNHDDTGSYANDCHHASGTSRCLWKLLAIFTCHST